MPVNGKLLALEQVNPVFLVPLLESKPENSDPAKIKECPIPNFLTKINRGSNLLITYRNKTFVTKSPKMGPEVKAF